MLTYLLVAIGGAIGSVLRFAAGNLGTALLGGSFPWATIAINVVGSAVIGFVGAAAVPSGLLPNSPLLRSLVMVGVCGGFTTFSSFSLQTLDLIRDGRVPAAAANIALSVLLCLGAVAAGHYGAEEIRLRGLSREADTALHPGAVALAVLDRPDRAAAILTGGLRVLQAAGGGRIEAMAVRPLGPGDVAATEDITPAGGGPEAAARITRLQGLWEDWRRDRGDGTDGGWTAPEGDASEIVAERGSAADLVVLGRSEPSDGARRHHEIHAAIFGTRRPVVMIPPPADPGEERPFGKVIAIAWDGGTKVRSAVRTSRRLLEGAKKVVVLTEASATDPDLPGIEAARINVEGEGPIGQRLLDAAHAAGADLIVMGAYRRGALRERLFGGATRHLLEHSDIALLMRH